MPRGTPLHRPGRIGSSLARQSHGITIPWWYRHPMKLRVIIIAATAALVAAVLPGGNAHADPWWLDYVVEDQFRNANSNKCLDVLWHSNDNGDPATQTPCAASEWEAGTHQWFEESVGYDRGYPPGVGLR